MKKSMLLFVLAMTMSNFAFAENFKGWGVGVQADMSRYDLQGIAGDLVKNKSAIYPAISVSYATGQANLVGIAELKGSMTKHTTNEIDAGFYNGELEQKLSLSAGYSAGYRVNENFLPYAKIDYRYAQLKYTETEESVTSTSDESIRGVGLGVGAKYAITPHIEVGAEYVRNRLKTQYSDSKINGDNASVGVTYRF